MAEINLLFQPTYTTIDTLQLDAAVSVQHQSEVDVTDHPVEDGSSISDHARTKPLTVTIEGIVSDTSTRLEDERGEKFSDQAYASLKNLRDTHKLIQIVTPRETYTDMILQSLSIPENAQTGEALRFTAIFKQIRIVKSKVTTQTVTLPKAKPKASLGKQPTKEAFDAAQETVDGMFGTTWARQFTDSAGLTKALTTP
jgi:hypothetical protein